jgi:hypothetical protein
VMWGWLLAGNVVHGTRLSFEHFQECTALMTCAELHPTALHRSTTLHCAVQRWHAMLGTSINASCWLPTFCHPVMCNTFNLCKACEATDDVMLMRVQG